VDTQNPEKLDVSVVHDWGASVVRPSAMMLRILLSKGFISGGGQKQTVDQRN
jgi:hypothetical protein